MGDAPICQGGLTVAFPSSPPPSLNPWEFSYNGFIFGGTNPVTIKQVQGLGDLAPIRQADKPRARDHGDLIGLDLYGGRDITIDLWVSRDGISLQHALEALAAATVVGGSTEQPLWFNVPGYPVLCAMARVRKRTQVWDVAWSVGAAAPTVQWHATDPRLYGSPQSATLTIAHPPVGLTFPVTFPVTFGAVTPNILTVTNGGNSEVRPLLVFTGPMTNPTVTNQSLPGAPSFSVSNPLGGVTVQSGDALVVDMDMHTVLYYVGGVGASQPASRASWVAPGSSWWTLQPGANTVQLVTQDSGPVSGTLQIQWSDGWML